jgi:hypothetical protein
MSGAIRRYTELPFLLDFLRTREIALLSPSSWDDKNDAHYLDAYAKAKAEAKSASPGAVRALCMTEASETYHHWKVFSSGSSGMSSRTRWSSASLPCLRVLRQALCDWPCPCW